MSKKVWKYSHTQIKKGTLFFYIILLGTLALKILNVRQVDHEKHIPRAPAHSRKCVGGQRAGQDLREHCRGGDEHAIELRESVEFDSTLDKGLFRNS